MSQTSLGTCRWINKAHSSTGIYSCSTKGTNIAEVEGQWPPSNWPNHSVSETQMTAPRLLHVFSLYPIPKCTSRVIMMSLNDFRIICSPILVGKALHMHRGIAWICLCLHWHPCQLFSSIMQEPCHVFHNPNFEPVTLSPGISVHPHTRVLNLLLEYVMYSQKIDT